MPYGSVDYAECPRCGKTAYGEDEIDDSLEEIELPDGTHKQVKFLSLTDAGLALDLDAEDAE